VYEKKIYKDRECKGCGETFKPRAKNHYTCTAKCYSKHWKNDKSDKQRAKVAQLRAIAKGQRRRIIIEGGTDKRLWCKEIAPRLEMVNLRAKYEKLNMSYGLALKDTEVTSVAGIRFTKPIWTAYTTLNEMIIVANDYQGYWYENGHHPTKLAYGKMRRLIYNEARKQGITLTETNTSLS
jgi:hypothetical protein